MITSSKLVLTSLSPNPQVPREGEISSAGQKTGRLSIPDVNWDEMRFMSGA